MLQIQKNCIIINREIILDVTKIIESKTLLTRKRKIKINVNKGVTSRFVSKRCSVAEAGVAAVDGLLAEICTALFVTYLNASTKPLVSEMP